MGTFLPRIALGAALLAAPAAVHATVIDFDNLDASSLQPVPLTTFTEDGYTFGLTFTTTGGARGPAIFDTTCAGAACNGDTDLIPGAQGENGIEKNVLILQEELPSNTPDDDGQSGTITFELLSGTAFRWEGASAIDDATFDFSTGTDGLLGSIAMGADNQTGKTTFSSSLIEVGDTFTIAYSGSGAIDSLILAPVPVPAALPLLIGALGGLGVASRRRARKTAA